MDAVGIRLHGRREETAAILPVSEGGSEGNEFAGQEYLGLYPYVTVSNDTSGKERIWIRDDSEK
jgi:hypothetical protein